jgi:hypothetical protein
MLPAGLRFRVISGGSVITTWDQKYHDNVYLWGNTTLQAGDDVEAWGTVTGNRDLTINAGTIEAGSAQDYANIRLHQTVAVAGSLVMTAGDDIEAAGTLMATGANGAGNMILNAGDDIDLDGTDFSAQSAGLMELIADLDPSNGTGNVDVDGSLEGNMKLSGTNVYVDGTVTSLGTLDVDADDDIKLRANVSSVGEITMDAGSDIELNRSSGNTSSSESTIILNAGDDVTIGRPRSGEGNVTANGKMDIFAGTDSDDSVKVFGKLETTNGGNIHVTAGDDIKLYGTFIGIVPDFESAQADGDLKLDAEDDVDVLGDLISNNGSIDIYSSDWATYLGGDVYAAYDVTLHNNTILDGRNGDQTIEAGANEDGTLTAYGKVWKTTEGNLYLVGNNSYPDHRNGRAIDLRYAGCLPAASTALGNLELYAHNGDIQISGDLTTFGLWCEGRPEQANGDFLDEWYDRPTGGVSVIARNGKIYTEGASVEIEPGVYVDVLNIGIVGNSDQLAGLGVDLLPYDDEPYENGYENNNENGYHEPKKAAIVVMSSEDLKFGRDTQLIARGRYYPAKPSELFATLGDFGDFFDGYSSFEDFFSAFDNFTAFMAALENEFGASWQEVFSDEGAYYYFMDNIGGILEYIAIEGVVDDRPAINFLATPGTAIGGVVRDEGDPIDVAIYVASTGTDTDPDAGQGDVHLDGRAIDVADGGTMVVDAYDTVSFGDFETFNLEDFYGCEDLACFLIKLAMRFHEDIDFDELCAYADDYEWPVDPTLEDLEDFLNSYFDEGFFFNIDRLEVASRITEWLYQAVGRLPSAGDPAGIAAIEAFIGGDYILRGAGLGNPRIIDGRAWVLVDPLSAAPLYWEEGEDTGQGPCVMEKAVVANMLGITVEGLEASFAAAYDRAADPFRELCDACQRFIASDDVLEDTGGARMAALAEVINGVAPPDTPFGPEVEASIANALATQPEGGVNYAMAEEFLDNLVQYVGILNEEMGYSLADSIDLAMQKHGAPITGSDNPNVAAYVGARLAAIGG